VGQALEISKRRSSRLAAAHHHLRRVARRNALRLQQQQQQRVTEGAAAATTTSSSSGSSRGHLAVALQEAGTLNSHSSSGTHRYVAFSASLLLAIPAHSGYSSSSSSCVAPAHPTTELQSPIAQVQHACVGMQGA
jgi:hypothetical protein